MEQGVTPPASTRYKVVDGQVIVPSSANERKGIQPVIVLTANGSECAVVNAGQPVHFDAVIEVPPHAGYVVAAEWDFEGGGEYPVVEPLGTSNTRATGAKVTLTRTYTFAKPGTYLPLCCGPPFNGRAMRRLPMRVSRTLVG